MKEEKNILKILKETKKSIKNKDTIKLKELSNQTIHTASITQDPDNVTIAVIIYTLSKIIERGYYQKNNKEVFYAIDDLIKSIEKKEEYETNSNLQKLRDSIQKMSGGIKEYIQDVFRKASINKASKIYDHGISMENTAKLLGITMFELAIYAGQTGVSETFFLEPSNVKEKIKIAMEMFE